MTSFQSSVLYFVLLDDEWPLDGLFLTDLEEDILWLSLPFFSRSDADDADAVGVTLLLPRRLLANDEALDGGDRDEWKVYCGGETVSSKLSSSLGSKVE